MTKHEYQSRPVTITAVQIDDNVATTAQRIVEAFGDDALNDFHMRTEQIVDSEGGPRRVVDITMTTIQGQLATAKPGEWLAREAADPTRFYPIADAAMRARYRVPVRSKGVSVVVDGADPTTIREALS